MNKSIYQLEFKLFFRNKAAWIGILLLFFNGLAGLYFGKAFIENQRSVIEKASVLQKENTKKNISHFGKDLGLLLYHNKFSIASAPDRWAAFANGQRDINPYVISVTMLGLEGQLYDGELSNPVTTLLGQMDLCFVFIFLFPLVIIAFSYNLLSSQKESGIWPILRSQTNKSLKVIWQKLLVRIIVIYVLTLILMFIAVLYLQLPIDFKLLSVFLIIFFYLAFWFAVSFFVISLCKSSSFNASALIAVWTLLCIVLPASLNLAVSRLYPVPEALQNVISQREGYHEKWDMDKSLTMEPFYRHYPQLKEYPFPKDLTFSWYWYYGMQQMGDDQAQESKTAIAKKLASRQAFTEAAALFLPGIQAQLGINELAASDLRNHLDFQQAVKQYHEKVRLYFYPFIFQNQDVSATNLDHFELQHFDSKQTGGFLPQSMSIAGFGLILILSALFNFRRNPELS